MSLQEGFDELMKDAEKLAKEIYQTESGVMIDIQYKYPVERDEIDTYQKILARTLELSEKTWMGKEHLMEFIRCARLSAGLSASN